jgi:glutaredoxin
VNDTSRPPSTRGSWVSLALIMLIVVGGSQAWSWWQGEQAARVVRQLAGPDSITLYTTSTCPYCAQARAWLKAKGVPWRECNVEQDQACQHTYEAQGAPGVPLVLANGQWHLGFDADWLAQALRGQAPGAQSRPSAETSPRP